MKWLFGLLLIFSLGANASEILGLKIEPEDRCKAYDRREYVYDSQTIAQAVLERNNGQIYSPYTEEYFDDLNGLDLDHIVALSEAHDSGLCDMPRKLKREFASDTDNIAFARSRLNRVEKRSHDIADWTPEKNKCWFLGRVIHVKLKYGLSIDEKEARVISDMASTCLRKNTMSARTEYEIWILEQYDSNGNGKISCREAREHGIAPVYKDDPAYKFMNDANNDGIVCG